MRCAQAPTAGAGGLPQPPTGHWSACLSVSAPHLSLRQSSRPALVEAALTRGGSDLDLTCKGQRALPIWQLWRGPGDPFTPSTRQDRAHLQPAPLGQDLNQPESQAGIGVLPRSPTSQAAHPKWQGWRGQGRERAAEEQLVSLAPLLPPGPGVGGRGQRVRGPSAGSALSAACPPGTGPWQRRLHRSLSASSSGRRRGGFPLTPGSRRLRLR